MLSPASSPKYLALWCCQSLSLCLSILILKGAIQVQMQYWILEPDQRVSTFHLKWGLNHWDVTTNWTYVVVAGSLAGSLGACMITLLYQHRHDLGYGTQQGLNWYTRLAANNWFSCWEHVWSPCFSKICITWVMGHSRGSTDIPCLHPLGRLYFQKMGRFWPECSTDYTANL